MKRLKITLEQVANYNNLILATHKAAKSKRDRDEVRAFMGDLNHQITELRYRILHQEAPIGQFKSFSIKDPKPRIIHAACFADRVLHHAVMNLAAPKFESIMIPHSYACLPGKGALAAVLQVQQYVRRFPWFVKFDIEHYFPNISHSLLMSDLKKIFKGQDFLQLLQNIISSYSYTPGQGLPIGALTSQYFANYHFHSVDLWLNHHKAIRAYVRYMDDGVFWTTFKSQAIDVCQQVIQHIKETKRLKVKASYQINRSVQGITYCGYRILPQTLRLTTRRKRRYLERRDYWESQFILGNIDEFTLQQAMASVQSTVVHANARAWLKKQSSSSLDFYS